MVKLLPPVSKQEQSLRKEQRFHTQGQIKSQWPQWHFLLCRKMSLQREYFLITPTVRVKLFIILSTFALLTADPLVLLSVLVTSTSFLYCLPILTPHLPLTSFLQTTPPSSLFCHYLIRRHTFFSSSLSSRYHIYFSLPFYSVSFSILPSFSFFLLRPFPLFPL